MNISGQSILTITQVANQVKYALEKNFANLWIQGEISSCKQYPSGHIYLTLKDGKSELSAVIFADHARKLKYKPLIGLRVTVNGSLSLYTARGKFQLIITNLYPTGKGELWLAYEALKEKLENEGLFSSKNKKNITKYPKRIGVITSLEGAVIRDIIQVLDRRAPNVSCLVYPVSVQGSQSSEQIVAALGSLNIYGGLDTIILARGGGSIEDLWSFNDESVIRAIYASKIPLITAIGHETDTTLSDFASDLRAPTPSAAAELVAEDYRDTLQYIDNLYGKLNTLLLQKINSYNNKINSYQMRHAFFKPNVLMEKWNTRLSDYRRRIKQSIEKTMFIKGSQLDKYKEKMLLLNPKSQLKRGFTIVTDSKDRIILSTEQVSVNDVLDLQVIDGVIKTKVKERKVYDA